MQNPFWVSSTEAIVQLKLCRRLSFCLSYVEVQIFCFLNFYLKIHICPKNESGFLRFCVFDCKTSPFINYSTGFANLSLNFWQFCCKCSIKIYGGTMRWCACWALCPEFAGSIPAPANLGGPPLTKWGSCQSGRTPCSAERCVGVHPGPVYPGYLPVQIRPLREAHLGLTRSHCLVVPNPQKPSPDRGGLL